MASPFHLFCLPVSFLKAPLFKHSLLLTPLSAALAIPNPHKVQRQYLPSSAFKVHGDDSDFVWATTFVFLACAAVLETVLTGAVATFVHQGFHVAWFPCALAVSFLLWRNEYSWRSIHIRTYCYAHSRYYFVFNLYHNCSWCAKYHVYINTLLVFVPKSK